MRPSNITLILLLIKTMLNQVIKKTSLVIWCLILWNGLICFKEERVLIVDLSKSRGNFHSYNHKVIYTTIIKNSQGGCKYKMGIQCYRLQLNVDYTFCIEILNTDYLLLHKARISVDKSTSEGSTTGNVLVRKFSHRYVNSKNSVEFMYYHRVILNFKKTAATPLYSLIFLLILKRMELTWITILQIEQEITSSLTVFWGVAPRVGGAP